MSTRKQIVGNLTDVPELRFGQSGKGWATFTVISNDGKDDKATKCVTRCKAFGDIAENAAASLVKGTRVIVIGREQTEEWESNGEKRSGNVVVVDSIGPDLRWATATVTRTDRPSVPVVQQSEGNDPWASAPGADEAPF